MVRSDGGSPAADSPDSLNHFILRGPADAASVTAVLQKEVAFSLLSCHRELFHILGLHGPSPPLLSLRPAALWAARALDLVGESGWVDFSGSATPVPLPSPWWTAAARSSLAAACLVLDAAAAEAYASSHPLFLARGSPAPGQAATGTRP